MFFPIITKNLNWEILTKNLSTLKKWDRVKDEKFHGKAIYRKELSKEDMGVGGGQLKMELDKKRRWYIFIWLIL